MNRALLGADAVGHPVDVASGRLFHDFVDDSLPGRMRLSFGRRYSSTLPRDAGEPFGPGWVSPFEMRLRKDLDGYRLLLEDGESEVSFDGGEEVLEKGGVLRHEGSFHELRKDAGQLVVLRWDPDSLTVLRFCFPQPRGGEWSPLARREFPDRQGIEIERDKAGRLVRLRQLRERRGYRLVYNEQGRVAELYRFAKVHGIVEGRPRIEEHESRVVQYEYDAAGRLALVRNAAAEEGRYEYDEAGRLKREINVGGMVFQFRYDDQGRCVETTGLAGFGRTRLRFDDTAQMTVVTDAEDNSSSYFWNEAGQVERILSPLATVVSKEFDEHGRIRSATTGGGRTTAYTYDERGDRVAVTDPSGAVTRFQFDGSHQLVCTIDPAGVRLERHLDRDGRIESLTIDDRAVWRYSYNAYGDLVSITDPLGGRKVFEWSDSGDRTRATDWSGNTRRFEFDVFGRVSAVTDSAGHRVQADVDAIGRVSRIRFDDGTERRYRRNAYDQLTEYVDEAGRTTRFRYSPCGQLLQSTSPTGRIVGYEWSLVPGRLLAVHNERGHTQSLVYDAAGRLTQCTEFDGGRSSFEYDADSYLVAETTPSGRRIEYARDGLGHVVEARYDDGSATTYEWNERGLLKSAANGHSTVEFEYDSFGRPVLEKRGEHSISCEYDSLGRRLVRKSSLAGETKFEWDANGQVRQLSIPGAGAIQFEYDSLQGELSRSMVGGVRIEQEYDSRGRRVAQRLVNGASRGGGSAAVGGGWNPNRRYEYDVAGSLVRVLDQKWGTTRFDYDAEGRLTLAEFADGSLERMGYDVGGDLVGIDRVEAVRADRRATEITGSRLDAFGRIVQSDGARYEFDAEGRLVRRLAPEGETRYVWNRRGELTEVHRPDGATWLYRYDAFGRRIEKKGGRAVTEYLWDGDHLLHEILGNGEGKRVIQWEFDPGSFAPVAKIEDGQLFLFVNDPNGTPRELISTDGSVAWSAEISPYGQLRRTHASQTDCPLRLAGQYFDSESGLHYNRFRYFSPECGRYLSKDPIGLEGSRNPYGYPTNPNGWIDPLGLSGKCPFGDLPEGATIVKEEPPAYVVYKTKDGETRIRFKASEAVTLQEATPGRNMSVDNLAGVNDQGQPYVLEGRHRAIGVARYGDTVPENLGGVPSAPGYLDYEHSSSQLSGGKPVKDMTIDRGGDVSRDQARQLRKQKYGFS